MEELKKLKNIKNNNKIVFDPAGKLEELYRAVWKSRWIIRKNTR